MHLWEFNKCVEAFNESKLSKEKESVIVAYQTAVFFNNAFSGKLKKLSYYLDKSTNETIEVKAFSPEQCREIEKRFAEKGGGK